jgi:hypothetical protein
MWKKRIHGTTKRRAYAAYVTSRQRSIHSIKKVINAYVKLFDRGIVRPKNKEVSEVSLLSIRQIQRYKEEIEISKIFLAWIKSITKVNIVIRAYVTLIENSFKNQIEKLYCNTKIHNNDNFFLSCKESLSLSFDCYMW